MFSTQSPQREAGPSDGQQVPTGPVVRTVEADADQDADAPTAIPTAW